MRNKEKLFNRNFVLLWQGQFVSQIGSWAFMLSIMLLIKQTTDSVTLVGCIMLVSRMPSLFLGPVGGAFTDRFSRRKIIIFSDLVNGLLILLLSVIMVTTINSVIIIPAVFVVSLFVAISDAFFRPAILASIPDIVPISSLSLANTLNRGSSEIARIIGQGLAGMLFRLLGGPILVFLNSCTYLFSALSESFIKIPQKLPEKNQTSGLHLGNLFNELVEGYTYAVKEPGLRAILIAVAALSFLMMPFVAFLPFYVEDILGVKSDWYGYLMALFGIGAIIGFTGASTIKFHPKCKTLLVKVFFIIEFVGLTAAAVIPVLPAAVILFLAFGILQGYIYITLITVIQLSVPSNIRGRVFGFIEAVTHGLSPIAMVLAGIAADVTGKKIQVIMAICGIVGVSIAIGLFFNRSFSNFLEGTDL